MKCQKHIMLSKTRTTQNTNEDVRYIDLTELAYKTATETFQELGLKDISMHLKHCRFNYYRINEIKESKPKFEDHFIARLVGCSNIETPCNNPLRFIYGNYSFCIGVIMRTGIMFICVIKRDGARWEDIRSDRFLSIANTFSSYHINYILSHIYRETKDLPIV